jgi:DNA-binding NarL/FixJ family response regulator
VRTYLIEPQSIFIPYLRRLLANAGCNVVATSQNVDGRDIVAHDPAAVFVDIDYLERSGPTALCRIREAARNAAVIALSERTDPMFSATCIISGASAVFSKSEGEEQLVRALKRALAAQPTLLPAGR